MNIMELLEYSRDIFSKVTLIYIWMAACLFMGLNDFIGGANTLFYCGLAVGVLSILTSPRIKKKLEARR